MIKKYWWILLIILFLGVFLILSKPKKKGDGSIPDNRTASPTPNLVRQEEFPKTLKEVGGVGWSPEIKETLPKELEKLSVKKKTIDIQKEKEILDYMGIDGQNGYIQKDFNYIQYTNMPENVGGLPTATNWDVTGAENKVKKMVQDLNGEKNLEIEWSLPVYRKYEQPYMVESTQNQAQFLEISGDYVVDGIKLTTFHGESFKAYFNARGNLLKFSIYLKPEVVKTGGFWQIMSLEEAKKSPAQNYRAGVNDLYEDINKVNVTQTELVEIFDNTKETIGPYFLLEGNTVSQREQKPVKITILLGAER